MKDNKTNELEFSTSEILRNMCHNIYNNFNNYESNTINRNYLSIRNSIFNIMQKITMKFGFKSQTFFLSAYYLDLVFIKKKKININIYKLGLACLCLSAKFCENDPIVPQLPYFVKIYNNITGYKNFISMTELMYAEVVVCKILKYKLNYYTAYDFISFFFCNGILKLEQIKEIEKEININNRKKSLDDNEEFELDASFIKNILGKIYRITRNYLDEIIKIDKICFKYNPIYISIYLVEKSLLEYLGNEYKINNSHLSQEELSNKIKNFCDRNKMYFKEIMNEFYKIHFENNEQYLQLLMDDDINNIFKKEKKNKIKDKDENVNFRNQLFNSTMTSRFYKKLKLSLNDENQNNNEIEINKDKKSNKPKNNEIENENINTNNNLDTEDDLNSNLNINELSKEMNYRYSHISKIKHIPKISMDKIDSFKNIENKKSLILNTDKNISMKNIISKDKNNLRKTLMAKSKTYGLKNSSSFKTVENGNKPYSKKLLGVNKRNIVKSINQSLKASTSTNFHSSINKNITKTESNDSNRNTENKKPLDIKEKPRILNTATTNKYKKIIKNIKTKNEMSSKIIRSKKIFKDKFDSKTLSLTKENFYPSNSNKINVNKIKNPEMKNLNINKELRTKKILYKFSNNNLSINNSSKDINKPKIKHYITENNNNCSIPRDDNEKNKINDKAMKYKKISYNKIHNDFIMTNSNKKKEIKKIIFTNKQNNNSIKEGYSFKTLNNINNGSSTAKQYKTINKETSDSSAQTTFSSFYSIIQRTKNLFNKDKNTNNKNTKIEKNNLNNKEDENKDFYKSQKNFYKKDKNINDEKINNDKKDKDGNTIIINNNININIGNKQVIKIPEINVNNTILTSGKKSINFGNKFNTQKLPDSHEPKIENNSTTKKTITFKSIFQKFNFNKKTNNKYKK